MSRIHLIYIYQYTLKYFESFSRQARHNIKKKEEKKKEALSIISPDIILSFNPKTIIFVFLMK